MHTNAQQLRSQVDQIWDKLWTGGLSNPLDAIEQLSYLLFLKLLDDEENARERQAIRRNLPFEPTLPKDMRWGEWTQLKADAALKHLKEKVFPLLKEMSVEGSSFREYMQGADCKIDKPGILIEVCKLIDQMNISTQEQDVKGDIYEYLLKQLQTSKRNAQFRTPRHIIRMMVEMIDPRPNERIGDLAAGTCGFLVGAHQYILEQHTSPEILYDEEGNIAHRVGDLLTPEQRDFLQNHALRGFDNDSGKTMLRIGSMNLILHGLDNPQFFYMDTLSKAHTEAQTYDVILMNPPFKGKVDKADLSESLRGAGTTKSELLFVHLILRELDMGGRCAVIVPDGVLFGSNTAHKNTRKKVIENNRLEAVISLPAGVFRPYSGVSTGVLIFTRGGQTDNIWFYDMSHDGFSLDDKRLPVQENDIPDVLECWFNRHDSEFHAARQARLAELRTAYEPLRIERLRLEADIHRLTFESVIAPESETAARDALNSTKRELADVDAQIAPLKPEIDQLTRQFWVSKDTVKDNKYDLSASRYRQMDSDEVYHEDPLVTMDRLIQLNAEIKKTINEVEGLLS